MNGKESIYAYKSIIFDDYNYPLYTLYDDNMLQSINYLSASSIDNIAPYTKLLIACLLHKIFKKSEYYWFSHWIQLNKAESQLYTQNCPKEIQTILETIFTIRTSHSTEQSSISDFTDYANHMYKTIANTIFQYQAHLILG